MNESRGDAAGREIFGESGVVGGGEGPAGPAAGDRGADAERAFGGDVDEVRLRRVDAAGDPLRSGERDAQLARRSAAARCEIPPGSSRSMVDAERRRFAQQRLDGADDAVNLGLPCVGDDEDAGQTGTSGRGAARAVGVGVRSPIIPAPALSIARRRIGAALNSAAAASDGRRGRPSGRAATGCARRARSAGSPARGPAAPDPR